MINTLIASRPGIGKTHYAINYYIDNISKGLNGVFISLELEDTDLMDKVLEIAGKKNISLNASGIRNLYINSEVNNLDAIINFIESITDDIKYIIIDYFQLLDNSIDFIALVKYLKNKGLSLLMTTQMAKGKEIEGQIFTDLLLQIREQEILQYFDDIKFISKELGIIELKTNNY